MNLKQLLFMAVLGTSAAASAQKIDASVDPRIDPEVRVFLKGLNEAGKGKTPIYKLPGLGSRRCAYGLAGSDARGHVGGRDQHPDDYDE